MPPDAVQVQVQAQVRRILGLHWSACFEGAPLPEPAPPIRFDDPAIVELFRAPWMRVMARPDRHARFWLREFRNIQLLTHVALHSSWLNDTARPVGTQALARQSGLSDRMVRTTLNHAVATGDLVVVGGQRPGERVLDLSPAIAASIAERDLGNAGIQARASGRTVPALPPAAMRAFHRLVCLMQLTTAGPLGTPLQAEVHRRSFRLLILDLLLDGPQPLAALVAQQAARAAVTPMTIRNTVRRAAAAGWVELGARVTVTPMARERFERAYAGLLLRWALVLDLMEWLARSPDAAEALTRELRRFEAG